MADWIERFRPPDEYYPGSDQKIPAPDKPRTTRERQKPQELADWDQHAHTYMVNGRRYEFFRIGALALALGRATVTIRLWEDQGIIPETRRGPSEVPGKGHRLYTRPQIEGLWRIAINEGLIDGSRRVNQTRFKERAEELFKALAQEPLNGARPVPEEGK